LDTRSERRRLAAATETLDIAARASAARRRKIVEALDLCMPERDVPDESKAADPDSDQSFDDPR
jgi:hypothetical protein